MGSGPAARTTPRSVTDSTVLLLRSTWATRFSIGLPQRLLPAPVVSTQGTLSRRRPFRAGSVTGPTVSGRHNTFLKSVMPRLAIAAIQRGSCFGRSPADISSSIVSAAS